MKQLLSIIFSMTFVVQASAQDDLLDMLDTESGKSGDPISATFKGTRLINGHTVETRKKKTLDFIISHRFGEISDGADVLWGLDQSNIRFGFDYGVTNRFNIGVGRSSFEKTFDGYLKYRLLLQIPGKMPLSVTLFTSAAIRTLDDAKFGEAPEFSDKLSYTYQALLARKFSSSVSIQLMPTLIHYNTIAADWERNDIYALGIGGRVKLTKLISLNGEYYYQMENLSSEMHNSVAIGFDIQTGGHVFQVHLTNSRAMIEKGFIAETNDDFFDGEIRLGFNISRTFQLGNKIK